jgi:mannose-P-dolichol utilization defect protein 1
LDAVQIASKIAGFGIMSGSLFLKVPQIAKILSSQSVEGLSPMAIYHELPLYSSGVIYHWLQDFPLSTYGESLVVLLQNVIIILLMWLYRKPPTPRQEIISQIAQFLVLSVIQVNLPKSLQPILVYINIPLLLTSCVPQASTY